MLLMVGILAYAVHMVVNEAKVRVTLEGQQHPFAPAALRFRVRVEPDTANRALTVALVSAEYERSSLEQLEGADAQITRWIDFVNVPAGAYVAEAVVHRPTATIWRAHMFVTVQ